MSLQVFANVLDVSDPITFNSMLLDFLTIYKYFKSGTTKQIICTAFYSFV